MIRLSAKQPGRKVNATKAKTKNGRPDSKGIVGPFGQGREILKLREQRDAGYGRKIRGCEWGKKF